MSTKILVIDGQGGRMGKAVIEQLRVRQCAAELYAVGTNSTATAAMLKGGADHGATGENAVVVNSRDADIIIGPVGIVIADSLLGEVTPTMSVAVGQSRAQKVLLPVNRCNNHVVGVADSNMSVQVDEAVSFALGIK